MRLNGNGEYVEITVKIADDVADDDCKELLENLQVSNNNIKKMIIPNKEALFPSVPSMCNNTL